MRIDKEKDLETLVEALSLLVANGVCYGEEEVKAARFMLDLARKELRKGRGRDSESRV